MRRLILLLTCVVLILAVALWLWTGPDRVRVVRVGGTGRWNRGPLTLVERTYLLAGLDRVLLAWQDLSVAGLRGPSTGGRSGEPNDPAVLVVDVERKELWVERRGMRVQPHLLKLPEDLTWGLYREGIPGVERLQGVVRLAVDHGTGGGSGDRFDLIGEGLGWYLQRDLGSPGGDTRWVETAFRPEDLQATANRQDMAISLQLVAEPNSQAVSLPEPSRSDKNEGQIRRTWDANNARLDWPSVERTVYAELERWVVRAGMFLAQADVWVAEDGETACVMIGFYEQRPWLQTLLKKMLGSRYSLPRLVRTMARETVAIDHVMPGIWYLRDVPDIAQHGADRVKMEFLLADSNVPIPAASRREALRIGRNRYATINPDMATRHRVTLASGAAVEVLGVCECPTARRPWWGPDGKPLKEAPWIRWGLGEEVPAPERYGVGWQRRRFGAAAGTGDGRATQYIVVVRVSDPRGKAIVGRVQWKRSGYDYGDVMQSAGAICVLVPSYGTGTQSATAVVGVTRAENPSNPEEGMDWVRLEKISLRPGADCGFKLVYPAEPPEPMESPQAPPRMGTFEVRRMPNEAIVRRHVDPNAVQTSPQR